MAQKTYGKTNWAENAAFRKANQQAIDRAFDIALRILDLLEAKGWRAADLARAMDVTPQYISRIVKGQELNLGNDVLDRLAAALGAPIMEVATSMPAFFNDNTATTTLELGVVHAAFSYYNLSDYLFQSPTLEMFTEQGTHQGTKEKKSYFDTSFLMLSARA